MIENKKENFKISETQTKFLIFYIGELLDIETGKEFYTSRERKYSFVRQAIYSILAENGLSNTEIALFMGKHRASVNSSLKSHKNDLEKNYEQYMTVYNKITNSKKIQRYLAEIRGGE